MVVNFKDHQKKIYSQFGQDGVIEKIFELIKPINKHFVEFGSCGTVAGESNTAYMRRYGFNGLLMDGSATPYGKHDEVKQYPVKIEFVTAENIIDLLIKYNVPKVFDFLSVDIDGNDYWVLKTVLLKYRPQVICVESNYSIPSDKNIVQRYKPDHVWDGTCRFGASYQALRDLGVKNGYSLVAICGCDMIFIRNESIPEDLVIENVNDIEKQITTVHDAAAVECALKQISEWDNWVDLEKA